MAWEIALGLLVVVSAIVFLVTGLRSMKRADDAAGGKKIRASSDPAPYEPTSEQARLMRGINEKGDPIPMPPQRTSMREAWKKPDRPQG